MKKETPTESIFNEIKAAAKLIWYKNYSDEFGYVTEKVQRIDSIQNYMDNVMVCYRMFDCNNQSKMQELLSTESINYINNNL